MTQINLIRDLAKSGYTISEIHELTKSDPKTINKYLEEDKKHWSKQPNTSQMMLILPEIS